MGARDFLERLRPSATPGAPSSAGVPADRVAERSAELEGVLSLLADPQARVQRTRAAAVAEAARRRAQARDRARAVVAEAERRAAAERSAAAAAAHARGRAAAEEIMAEAQREACDLGERARTRQPDLVARVLRSARAEIAAVVEASR